MPLKVTRTDAIHPVTGRAVFHYEQADADRPAIYTAFAKGSFQVLDGTVYNVSDDYIEVESHAHAGELSHHIGVKHETDSSDYEWSRSLVAGAHGRMGSWPDYHPVRHHRSPDLQHPGLQ